MDITSALLHRVRGNASEVPFGEILVLLNQEIQDFVVCISNKLDQAYPSAEK